MTSGIIFVIIPYCTIYYLLHQEFLTYLPICKVLLNFLQYQLFLNLTILTVTILFIINLFLIVLDISNASSITYHISCSSCFGYCLVFFFLFYCISHLQNQLLILSLQYSYQVGFFYQLPLSGPSISVVIISATPLSYFYQHTISAIKQPYHLFT